MLLLPVIASLVAGAAALLQCNADYQLVNGANLKSTMDRFVPVIMQTLNGELSNPQHKPLLDFMTTRTKACQSDCLNKNFENVMAMMWRSGKLQRADTSQLLQEGLTGAFRACYPNPPYTVVKPFIDQVVQRAGAALVGSRRLMDSEGARDEARRLQVQLPACPHVGGISTFGSSVTEASKPATEKMLFGNKDVNQYLSTQGKQCQFTCYQDVMTQGFQTFYESGLSDAPTAQANAPDIVLGALKACFPGIPRNVLAAMSSTITSAAVQGAMTARSGAPVPAPAVGPALGPKQCAPAGGSVDGMSQANFLSGFRQGLQRAFNTVSSSDPMGTFLPSTYQCQQVCMESLWMNTADTLWRTGRLSLDPSKVQASQGLLTEALAGGFRGCYPRPPVAAVHAFASKVSAAVMHPQRRLSASDETMVMGHERRLLQTCPQQGRSSSGDGKAWVDQFLKSFPSAFRNVAQGDPNAKNFFDNVKDCQNTCVGNSVKKAVETYMDSGMMEDPTNGQPWFLQIMIGAFRTCYPAAPRAAIEQMVTQTLTQLTQMGMPWPTSQPQQAQPSRGSEVAPGNQCAAPTSALPPFNMDLTNSMNRVLPKVGAALGETRNADPRMQSFLASTKDCQTQCFQFTMPQAIQTLFLTGAFNPRNLEQALTGAFRACYPTPPRQDMLIFMEKVSARAAQLDQAPGRRLVEALAENVSIEAEQLLGRRLYGSCANANDAKKYVDLFMTHFPNAMNHVLSQNAQARQFFANAKNCENSCSVEVLRASMSTFYAAGLASQPNHQVLATDQITGSMKACYPGLPHDQMQILVQQMLPGLPHPSGSAIGRLFDAEVAPGDVVQAGGLHVLVWAVPGAGVVALTAAALLALRRRRSQNAAGVVPSLLECGDLPASRAVE
eukprot:TRINITY_DN14187_c0_g1_i1.p1 TRINITY_DN14187_c0_g1~~TRINITY_DN14187_c0_g1_i1.p1  ORF type:complete len:906 (-),score=169.87 TRINITY_DN14187_c0_g1_i1:81-2762(-)